MVLRGDFNRDFNRDFSIQQEVVYDLSGLTAARGTIEKMIVDQTAGRVKFAGGNETWVPRPVGWFGAIVAVGGGLVGTTTNVVRSMFTVMRSDLFLLAAGAGPVATAINVVAASGSLVIPRIGGTPLVQNTNYDLSGIAAAQSTITSMISDAGKNITSFTVGNYFPVIFSLDGTIEPATMLRVLAFLAAVRSRFDLLAQ